MTNGPNPSGSGRSGAEVGAALGISRGAAKVMLHRDANQGAKSCVYPEETEEGRNDRFTCTTQETATGQGNLKNRGDSSTEQTASEGTGSGKCPPGQFTSRRPCRR